MRNPVLTRAKSAANAVDAVPKDVSGRSALQTIPINQVSKPNHKVASRKPSLSKKPKTSLVTADNRGGVRPAPKLKRPLSFRDTSHHSTSSNVSGKTNDVVSASDNVEPQSRVSETIVEEPSALPSYSSRLLPAGVEDIDDSTESQYLCPSYAAAIYEYLRIQEADMPISDEFMSKQQEVTFRMRSILVDWIVQVHCRFDLLVETLYMAISIIDRYLDVESIERDQFQLLGVTALFVAAKFEEMYPPELKDFVYITDSSYSKKDILGMEIKVLKALSFRVNRPLPIHFLRRISRASNCSTKVHAVAKYIMELSILDSLLANVAPSLIAASAFRLATKALGRDVWDIQMEHYSGYKQEELYPIEKVFTSLLVAMDSYKFQAVKTKYSEKTKQRVSLLPELSAEKLKQI